MILIMMMTMMSSVLRDDIVMNYDDDDDCKDRSCHHVMTTNLPGVINISLTSDQGLVWIMIMAS